MKKFLSIILASLTLISIVCFGGCNVKKGEYTFYVPDGAPALAVSKFIYDNQNFEKSEGFAYSVVSSTVISGAISVNDADFAILPLNTATKLYKSGKEAYQMVSVITHGNFYIMSKGEISTVSGLKGKVLYLPNKGKVPDLTLKCALKSNGLEYEESDSPVSGKVALSYFNEAFEVMAKLVSGNYIGMLPEPAANTLIGKNINYEYSLDLQRLYDEEDCSYPQAVLMAKKKIVESDSELISKMATLFNENIAWAKANPARSVNAIKSVFDATTLQTTISANAIEKCNIFWQSSSTGKEQVLSYISKIREINVSLIDSVEDDFFA